MYFTVDAGRHWQPLTLKLPAVRVNDIEIQPQQHAVVLATFGRGFWVLDNLQFLENLAAAQVSSDAPYLFEPQQAWLVTRRMGGSDDSHGPGGQNLAPGVTVFFQLPADYNGNTPVKLSFADASGKPIRSFTLHLKKKKAKPSPPSENPAVKRRRSEEKAGDRPGADAVPDILAVDESLAEQLSSWPAFRPIDDPGPDGTRLANHCPHCGTEQDDRDLHNEPGDPIFDIPHAPLGTIRLTPLTGEIRLGGDEHFMIE